jgi:tetratricopeptide (TPR) repeat protein
MTDTERKKLFQEGLKAGQKRDYVEAIRIFSRLADGEDPKALLYLGRSYHGLGDYGRAIQLFQTYLGLHGESAEVQFFLGRSWLAARQPLRAAGWFEKALANGFDRVQTLGLLGTSLLKGKDPLRAVEVLQEAVELAPQHRGIYVAYLNSLFVRALQLFHNGQADLAQQMLRFLLSSGAESSALHLYLAVALRELGKFDEALPHFQTALEASPDDPVLICQTIEALFASGRQKEGQDLLKRHEGLLPQGLTRLSNELMEELLPLQYLQQGKLRRAIYFALKNLKRHPEDAQLSLILGEAYRQLGQLEKAAAHFEKARKTKSVSEAEYGLLLVHWQSGNFAQALVDAQRLLRSNPDDPTVLYYLTLLKCRQNYPSRENIEALRDLIRQSDPDPFLFAALAEEYHKEGLDELSLPWIQRTLSLDPENKSAVETLAAVLPHLVVPEWKKAFTDYLKLRPDDGEILRLYVRRLLEAKDWPEAQKRLLDWMALGHRNVGSLRALAYVYRMRSQFADAFLVYRDLLHTEPKNPEYLSGVILCLYKTKRKQLALDFARQAAAAVPPNARFAYQIGLIAQACGDHEQAERNFRKAIEIDPHHGPSFLKLSELFAQNGDKENAERYLKHAQTLKTRTKPLSETQDRL